MLKLRFFAGIRERFGRGTLELPLPPACASVDALIAHLDQQVQPGCAEWLRASNTLVAVNRAVTDRSAAIGDGDEVAFYPPVTGG